MGSSRASYGVLGMCAMMMAMMIMAGGVAGQGPAAAPSADCNSVVVQLVDCLSFISGTVETPPATCCSNLSAIITNSPQCLCQLYNTTFTEPLGINVTRALQLPPACKLTTPNPSLCTLIGVPVAGPMAGPVSSPSPALAPTAMSPSSAPTPAASVSAPTPTVPPTAPPSSSSISSMSPPAAALTPPAAATPPSPNGASSRSFSAAASLLVVFTLFLLH